MTTEAFFGWFLAVIVAAACGRRLGHRSGAGGWAVGFALLGCGRTVHHGHEFHK